MQIVAEHPWLGVGWNRPEPTYDNYYRAGKVEDARAIEMSDYLMPGATLGRFRRYFVLECIYGKAYLESTRAWFMECRSKRGRMQK